MAWRASLGWMMIIACETVHGVLRRLFLAPWLGEVRAAQWGVPIGAGLILILSLVLAGWIGARRIGSLLLIGVAWAGFTLLFELGLGLLLGRELASILAEYDLAKGGLMSLGLTAMLLAPLAAARLTGRLDRGADHPHHRRLAARLPYPANDDG